MKKDRDKTKEQLLAELDNLRKKSKERQDKLKASNQQLDAYNQQLRATEQQLGATNQRLIASEAKFKSYIQNAPDGIFISNEKGKYIEVNKAACEITGYSEYELLKLINSELIQEEYSEKTKNHFQTVVKEGFASGELGFVTKSDEKRFWSFDAVKLSETRFLEFAKDITERKQAEIQLLQRMEMERLADRISARLINVKHQNIDTVIRDALDELCSNIAVDRGNIYLSEEDGDKALRKYEWCSQSVKPLSEDFRELNSERFPWCKEKIGGLEIIQIANLDDIPEPGASFKEIFKKHQTKSLLLIPMEYNKNVIGAISFETVKKERV